MADFPHGADAPDSVFRAGTLVNLAGAALSIGLIVGVGVWGYKLIIRDVTGVPVVQAIEGPMRIAPENPGGEVALHRGLSVNAIAAEGEAEPGADRLLLAPAETELTEEDLEVTPVSAQVAATDAETGAGVEAEAAPEETAADAEAAPEAPAERSVSDMVAAAVAEAAAGSEPMSAEDVLALADSVSEGVEPLGDLPEGEDVPVRLSVDGEEVTQGAEIIPASVPGVSTSLRPQARPMRVTGIEPTSSSGATTAEPAATPEPTRAAARTVSPEEIPAGTALVQLGAFDSPEVAREEWGRLTTGFAEFMTDKSQVIQEAESGGRTFYRLRAKGFTDLAAARRFCAALVAEDALCIPVVVR